MAGMRELLRDVRAADVITLIASNYPTWIEDIEHTVIANVADHLVVSCRIGERKPDAAFYTQVAATAGVPTDAITFVDDRAKNVEGAEATGMVGILFETADQVRADLENLGLTLPRRAPERR
ncbi:MAG: putative hydrolase of the HAD superfamily [Glaciecola sp.]